MTKYKWDLYELRDSISLLQKIYETETNQAKKEVIMSSIFTYKNMIELIIKKDKSNNELLNDNLEYNGFESVINEQIVSYQNNDSNILNIILQSYLPFRDTYSLDLSLNNIPIAVTNHELVTVTNDFINKMIPSGIKEDFLSSIKEKNRINFSYSKQNDSYSGITLFEPIFERKYIFVSRTNMIIDLVTLPHELFHYVLNDIDVGLAVDNNMYYTTEIEGSFANILFGDYFYQNSYEHNNYFNKYFLEIFHNGITEMVVRNSLLNAVKDNKKFRMHKFNKELDYWGIIPFTDKEEISEYLVDPIEINMKYALGYLIGIDLYYIYKKDPELAFYLLKNIKFMKNENDINGLLRRNHITFMDDEYENLKKYVKKIERQN